MALDEKREGVAGTDSNGRMSDEEKNLEAKPIRSKQSKASDDPFGDEQHSEVKYKTMAWW